MEFKLISEEVLKLAFLKGIDNFIELYNLQSNKNFVSKTLGNLAMNVKKSRGSYKLYSKF
ncbi:hypothetical protein A2G94_02010 [Francisella endosymbiont of Ornithodoros moubata]|uniref:hypothetical protein n=1 Tax=Francisella-like endosymbiont TaxID=512373 RepID=UPI000A2212EB|nr:hypothetical protein A2G94_02010 [Francisella endosymbiont of Ornithodoros moubata]